MNMIGRALKIFFLFVLAAFPATAQHSVAIDSRIDKSTIRIGDVVTYSITVTRSPEVEMMWPGMAANLGAFEIRSYEPPRSEKKNGLIADRVAYTISTFDIGEFEIPPLTFRYTLPGDTTQHILQTEKLKIVVESLKPSEAGDIRDIKGPLGLPRSYRQFILWGSLALAVALLLSALYYVYQRKKAGKSLLPKKVEPPRPPHEVALQALQDLKSSSLLAEGRVKEYYIRVSEIIRRYIEGRYFIVALELTTYELIERLRAADVEPEMVQLTQEFLDSCDLVKFAKYQPTEDENQQVLERAFEIVERTKLVYDQPAAETAPAAEASKSEVVLPEAVEEAK